MKYDTAFESNFHKKYKIDSCLIDAHNSLPEEMVLFLMKHKPLYGALKSGKNGLVVIIDYTKKMTKNPLEYEHYIKETYREVIGKYYNKITH